MERGVHVMRAVPPLGSAAHRVGLSTRGAVACHDAVRFGGGRPEQAHVPHYRTSRGTAAPFRHLLPDYRRAVP